MCKIFTSSSKKHNFVINFVNLLVATMISYEKYFKFIIRKIVEILAKIFTGLMAQKN